MATTRFPTKLGFLVSREIEGELCVFDYPHRGAGRRYFVEVGFESKAELAILLADYRRQAERLGACPMGRARRSQAPYLGLAGPPSP